jgi:hypothetical protein
MDSFYPGSPWGDMVQTARDMTNPARAIEYPTSNKEHPISKCFDRLSNL